MYSKNRNSRASIYDFYGVDGVDDAAYLAMIEEAAKVRKRREIFEANEKSKLQEITENAWDSKGQWWERDEREGERERELYHHIL